jgi:hypothetical protein
LIDIGISKVKQEEHAHNVRKGIGAEETMFEAEPKREKPKKLIPTATVSLNANEEEHRTLEEMTIRQLETDLQRKT